jgi:hypothetical protein
MNETKEATSSAKWRQCLAGHLVQYQEQMAGAGVCITALRIWGENQERHGNIECKLCSTTTITNSSKRSNHVQEIQQK